MCEDGFLKKEDALIDIEKAKEVYLAKKKTEEYPQILFILSPIIHDGFGDEEMYNMAKFFEAIGEDAKKVLTFELADSNHPGYGVNKMSNSCFFFTGKNPNASTFLTDTMEFRTRFCKCAFKLIDLIRYILGIYEIKNNQVIITTNEIYPKINNKELAFSVLNQHYQIMYKEQRYINPREWFDGIRKHRGDINYLISSYPRTVIDITKLVNEKADLDTLVKWGMLTLDNKELYHVNHETYTILPFILDFDARLQLIYKKIYDIFNFFKFPREEDTRKNFFQQFIYNNLDAYNLTNYDIENITFFITKFSYIIENFGYVYTQNSFKAFKEYYYELELFINLLNEKNKNLVREK